MKKLIKLVIILVGILLIGRIVISVANQWKVSTIENCKVIELQQQQLIGGSDKSVNTEIRYLVITDNETFICENSLLNAKFNNSDIFWHLKKDSTYTFRVAGLGKTMVTDYRNILKIVE